MIFKGSGRFQDAPDLGSRAGMAVFVGVAVLLAGVVFAAVAGFGRDRALKKLQQTSGGFLGGLIMAVISGVLSSFMAFVFVYSQDPTIAHFSDVDPKGEITITTGAQKQKCTVSDDGTVEIAGVGPVRVGGLTAAVAAERIADRIRSARQGDPPEVRVETGSITAIFAVFAVGLVAGAAAEYRLCRPSAQPQQVVARAAPERKGIHAGRSSSASISAWRSCSGARACCSWAPWGPRSAGASSKPCR